MTPSGPSLHHGPGPALKLAAADRRALALVLAGGRGTRLLDLGLREARPALPMAGRRRLVDFALQEVARAGLPRALVATQHCPSTLRRHLPEAWGGRLALDLRDGAEAGGFRGTADALRRLAPAIGAGPEAPAEVVVLSGGRAGGFDLPALLAAHRAGSGAATLLALPAAPGEGRLAMGPDGAVAALDGPSGTGDWAEGGAVVLDWPWARDRLAALPGHDLLDDLLPLALAEGALRAAPQPGAIWRDAATPDAFRRAWLELAAGVPFPLPPETGGQGGDALGGPDLVMEAGGLTLTVPRFGARRGGRWTLLEDSVVMPGARVAPGARLTRALVAPGAIVPAGLVVGEDPDEDARWFRPTPEGTVLVTAPMLARRAAERMRLQAQGLRPAGLTPAGSA